MKLPFLIKALAISAAFVAIAVGRGWADDPYQISRSCTMAAPVDRDYLHASTWNMGYQVIRGSESYTLDEFISSGKFCEWRGKHEWVTSAWPLSCIEYGTMESREICSICHRCRRRIKVHQENEVWEP